MTFESNREDLRKLADGIHKELSFYGLMLGNLETLLQAAVIDKGIEVLNRYNGHFSPTMVAYKDACIIAFVNLIDNDLRLISIPNALKVLIDVPELAENLDVEALSRRLEDLKVEMNRMVQHRQNTSAHRNMKVVLPVLKAGELRPAYERLVGLFQDICSAPRSTTFNFTMGGSHATNRMIEKLQDS